MDKETIAILRLQDAAQMSERIYQEPLVLTYSGGKDSDVLVHLADAAGIDYEVIYSLTTVDAPQTIKHIRQTFHKLENDGIKCSVDIHRRPEGGAVTMWNLIVKKASPPLPLSRYCCNELKEASTKGRFAILGVRRSESRQRNKRQAFEIVTRRKEDRVAITSMDNEQDREAFESCPIKGKRNVNPIVDWTDQDVWDYIHAENIETNPLYQCGYDRVGCVGCPLKYKRKRQFDFERYPKYKENYIRTFDKMLAERERRGLTPWHVSEKTGEAVFEWWVNG